MSGASLTKEENKLIDDLVDAFSSKLKDFEHLKDTLKSIVDSPELAPYVHSIKARVKDPSHFRDKLERKFGEKKKKGESVDYDVENLFLKVNDLVGVRILHLHTSQFLDIDRVLRDLLKDRSYEIILGPTAHTWDDEYKEFFNNAGVETASNPRLYTSVHYVIRTGNRNTKTAEIQVRTLAEELWGEVDHSVNYPHASDKIACVEQIKVLARITSSCTRLVDSIFKIQKN